MAVSLPEEKEILVLDGDLSAGGTLPFILPPGLLAFGPDGAGIAVLLELHPGEFSAVLVPRTGGFTAVSAPFPDTVRQALFSRDGRSLYLLVAGPRGGLSVVDLASLAESRRLKVCADPAALDVMRDGRRAFLLCAAGEVAGAGEVAEIDLELGIVVRKQPLRDSCGARGFFLSSSETALLVWCAAAGQLLILDRVTLAPFDSVAAEPGEATLVSLRGGGMAGVLYRDPPRLGLIDLGARAVVGSEVLEDTVLAASVSAGGRFLYLAGVSRLARFDVRSRRIDRSIQLPGRPGGMALWPGDWESKMRWFFR
ncbi:hypothetical protein HRbin33_00813 [bacterium HR33]|nr:hypothetical protein HRbin33_00813 [bacterium HR33]